MNQNKKTVGETAARIVHRVAKISSSAINAAVKTARETTDPTESVKSVSNADGTKLTSESQRELKVFMPQSSASQQANGSQDSRTLHALQMSQVLRVSPGAKQSQANSSVSTSTSQPDNSNEDASTKDEKLTKVIVVDEDDNDGCDFAYVIDGEAAAKVINICCSGELVCDDEPEHPLYPERHKWAYRAQRFREKHRKLLLTGKTIENFGFGLLKMSGVAVLMACVLLGLAIFLLADYELLQNNDYRADDLFETMGTTAGSDIDREDASLNTSVYSEFPSYLQVTPVGAFGRKHPKDAVGGKNFSYTQSSPLGLDEGFVLDLWVSLPKGHTNDSLCVMYPEQLSSEDEQSLQAFLVNRNRYRNVLLQYMRTCVEDDEEKLEQLDLYSDDDMEEIVSFLELHMKDYGLYSQDMVRHQTWRSALESRTMVGQIDLHAAREGIDLRRDSFTEELETFDIAENFLAQQRAGEIPQGLIITAETAKIVHYQVKFTATNTDYYVVFEGDGFFGNTKLDMLIRFFVVSFIILIIVTFICEIKWIKPTETEPSKSADAETKKSTSAET